MNRSTLWRGIGWSMVSVGIFAGWFVTTRFSVTHELRFWDVIALRFGIGALLLLPVLVLRWQRLKARAGEGLLYAILWGAPFVLLLTLGLQLSSAAQSSAVTPTLMPVFAGLISALFLGEKLGRSKVLAYAAIACGTLVLVLLHPVQGVQAHPVALAPLLLASVMWAIYTLRFKRSDLTPLESATLMCIWSAVLYLPVYVGMGVSRLATASLHELLIQGFYQGVLMSVVAMISFNRAVTLIGARGAAAIIAFVPVLAALLAIPFVGEVPTPSGAFAIALIACGVILAAWSGRRAAPN
jgi:drug/metabolite transporter (DMT)-like permease